MGGFSIWHWVVVLIIVLVLFGRGRVADIMGEFGRGITSFKRGVNEETSRPSDNAARIEPPVAPPAAPPVTPTATQPPAAQPAAQPVEPAPAPGATDTPSS